MAEGRLTDGLTWRLNDPGMGLLERAGLAALYMSLRAAEEQDSRDSLAPLYWNDDDLTAESVTIRSAASDKEALLKLFGWAWQVRDGVFYLPAVHRDGKARDNSHFRVPRHNGILRTFFQHPRVQPKGDLVERFVDLDEGQQIKVVYQTLDSGKLKPLGDLQKSKFFDRSGTLSGKAVELSGWVSPGIAPRFANEGAWEGPSHLGLLLMLAPIVCLYLHLHSQRGTWLFVVPDVGELVELDLVVFETLAFLDPAFADVASLGDAGLRFLAEYSSRATRTELQSGCRVVAMGKVGYYPNQSVRKGIVDVSAPKKMIRRYQRLHQIMGNRLMRRKVVEEDEDASIRKGRRKKNKKQVDTPQATHFVSVPTGRGRIADNLIAGQPWYAKLVEPLPWDRDFIERMRKTHPGTSIERLWFQNLCYQRGRLMELIKENDMWDDESDRLFVEAFWEIMAALYRREADAVKRGGSRTWQDRCEDLNEEIRRSLTRAKTGPLLRETLADLFSRPVEKYRSKAVRSNPGTIWRLIDGDWKRGRDLALLALASYTRKEKHDLDKNETSETVETTS